MGSVPNKANVIRFEIQNLQNFF